MTALDTYAAFSRVPDPVIVATRDGRVIFCNDAARAVVPAGATTWGACFPSDREEAEAAFHRVVSARETIEFEWSFAGASARAYFGAKATALDDDVLVISRDITTLKRTEERLRSAEKLMVDTQGVAHLGLWEWDTSQPQATWSAELYRIYGLTPEAYTPSYEAYLTMVHPDDRQRVIDATNRVFHEHVPYSHDERIFRPDGTMRYLHTWAFPLLDETGKLTHLIGVCQDITDRALAEEALQRANNELEQRVADRTQQLETVLHDLEAFNAMVSHDLRAPLAVVQMSVDLLGKSGPADETTVRYREHISRAVSQMSALLDDLLAFARVGQEALQPATLDVTAVCRDIVSELRAANPDRAVTVEIQPELVAVADPALFRVVVANLIGNAWKYTQHRTDGRIEITGVTTERTAIHIRDNGIGFDMAEYDQLFAPFKRLRNATGFPGTGIGLATVQRIVERHGGSVRATSQQNQGATFVVELPRSEAFS